MADTKPADFSTTAASNATVGGINIAEGSSAAQLNDAIRAVLAVIKTADWGAGGILADVIAESTSGEGVTVDGLLIKDGAVNGNVPSLYGGVPIGAVVDFAGETAPDGYLICDGSAVSRTTYADLFTAIGTTWGMGDGSTTFNVPDLLGRTTIGAGTGTDLTARTLGATGGEETHELTSAENGPHTHGFGASVQSQAAGTAHGDASPATRGVISATQSSGSGNPHNNMQPFGVVTKIIRAL